MSKTDEEPNSREDAATGWIAHHLFKGHVLHLSKQDGWCVEPVTFAPGPAFNAEGLLALALSARDALLARLQALIDQTADDREALAALIIRHGFTTGHGETTADLLRELDAQLAAKGQQ